MSCNQNFKFAQIARFACQELFFENPRIYCENGKIDVETDGDAWHVASKAQIEKDKLRDNDLTTQGWRVLRFNTGQLEEKLSEYCLAKITENINNLGGIKEGEFVTRKIDLKRAGGIQLKLFDS